MQHYKDDSGLQFINFDFVAGGQEIKVSILVEFSDFSRYLFFLVRISLRLALFAFFFSFWKAS